MTFRIWKAQILKNFVSLKSQLTKLNFRNSQTNEARPNPTLSHMWAGLVIVQALPWTHSCPNPTYYVYRSDRPKPLDAAKALRCPSPNRPLLALMTKAGAGHEGRSMKRIKLIFKFLYILPSSINADRMVTILLCPSLGAAKEWREQHLPSQRKR